jgi:hypothetical protein
VPGSRGLAEQDWFHGVLPREEVVRLLRTDGDFLVRETMRNEERQVVLSVCWGGHKHFIVQTTAEVRIHNICCSYLMPKMTFQSSYVNYNVYMELFSAY